MENWVNIEGGKLQWCKIPNGPFGCTTNFDYNSQVSKTPQLDIYKYIIRVPKRIYPYYISPKTTGHKMNSKKNNIFQTLKNPTSSVQNSPQLRPLVQLAHPQWSQVARIDRPPVEADGLDGWRPVMI